MFKVIKTAEQVEQERIEQLTENARAKRDRLLAQTDWVVTRATETSEPVPAEWATYRQALRDVPQQSGFPENIDWPVHPEETE